MPDTTFGLPRDFQAPRSVQVSARLDFEVIASRVNRACRFRMISGLLVNSQDQTPVSLLRDVRAGPWCPHRQRAPRLEPDPWPFRASGYLPRGEQPGRHVVYGQSLLPDSLKSFFRTVQQSNRIQFVKSQQRAETRRA